MADKKDLIQVFNDTIFQCENEISLALECKRSIESQTFYYDEDEIEIPFSNKNRFEKEAIVLVSPSRTFKAASLYKNAGNVTVLNFASSRNPGGGVANGSRAQEECLCRCSTLYPCLSCKDAFELFYDVHRKELDTLYNDDIIFTPQVVVFKSDEEVPANLPLKDRFYVNVITCAAPNINAYIASGNALSEETLRSVFKKRMKKILEAAAANRTDALILGAFGCGAFGNDALLVAECWKEVLPEFMHDFKAVEFAVYCARDNKNYMDFRRVFG